MILDMDGLLLDTERLSLEAFHAAARVLRFEAAPDELCRNLAGYSDAHVERAVRRACGDSPMTAAFLEEWERLYREAEATDGCLKPAASMLLDLLDGAGVQTALATSTPEERALRVLRKVGLIERFDVIVTGSDVPQPKPHPDLLLLACRRLGRAPAECLALDDTECGVAAAVGAGVRVVFVEDVQRPSPSVRRQAIAVVESLQAACVIIARLFGAA
ncbi:MAG: HAD family hydrolase [Thermoanaerobaculia bacterium]